MSLRSKPNFSVSEVPELSVNKLEVSEHTVVVFRLPLLCCHFESFMSVRSTFACRVVACKLN